MTNQYTCLQLVEVREPVEPAHARSKKAVVIFFDTARNEHIPRKYARSIFPTKTELTAMLSRFSIVILS